MNSALNMLTNDFQIDQTQKVIKPTKSLMKPNIQIKSRPYLPAQYQPINYGHSSQNNFSGNRYFQSNNNPNKNIRTNNLKPISNTNLPKPTPMSISTRNTLRPQNQSFQNYRQGQFNFNQNRPNYIAEELFNIDDQPAIEFPEETENFENVFEENTENFVDEEEADHFLENDASDQIKSITLN